MILLVSVARAAPPSTSPASDPLNQDGLLVALSAADIDRLFAGLDDPSAEVREKARLRLTNLPGSAYASIKARFKPDDLSPEVQAVLERSMTLLAARSVATSKLREDLRWLEQQAVESYEDRAEHNPAWDADARRAMLSFETAFTGGAAGDAQFALFSHLVNSGCNDPIVLALYTGWHIGRSQAAEFPPTTTEWRVGPRLLYGKVDVPFDFGDRLRASVEYADRKAYPEIFRCVAHQELADFLIARDGDKNEIRRNLDASADLLATVLKTSPQCFQLNCIGFQLRLEIKSTPGVFNEAAFERLFQIYSSACPGAAGPLIFKADWSVKTAMDLHDGLIPALADPDREPKQAKLIEQAAEAAEAGLLIDPKNSFLPSTMIEVATLRGDSQEQMEAWFTKAMAADPDNGVACIKKCAYLMPTWHGSAEAVLNFATECMHSDNYRGRVAMLPIDAHNMLGRESGLQARYFQIPAVWDNLRETYEAYLDTFPNATKDRTAYAKLAFIAGKFAIAHEQLDLLGDRADVTPWGGQRGYDFARLETAKRARPGWRPKEDDRPRPSPGMARALLAAVNPQGGDKEPLRKVANEFPEMQIETTPGKAHWNQVILNNTGIGFDCVRFRTPKGAAADMRLCHVRDSNLKCDWAIMPVASGDPSGFIPYWYPKGSELLNVRGPGDGGEHYALMQAFPAANLQPDTEYLLCFKSQNSNLWPMSIAITFVPPLDHPGGWLDIKKDFGIRAVGE